MVAAIAVAAVLLRFPPERYAFYPRCPVYEVFGLLCPGCGATRAASALLHGHLMEALHWNALFTVSLIALTVYAIFIKARGSTWIWPQHWMVGLAVTAALAFGVIRNL